MKAMQTILNNLHVPCVKCIHNRQILMQYSKTSQFQSSSSYTPTPDGLTLSNSDLYSAVSSSRHVIVKYFER